MAYLVSAPMTLVSASVKINLENGRVEHRVYHSMTYARGVLDSEGIRQAAQRLADSQVEKDYTDKAEFYEILEYGVIAPDLVELPMGTCESGHKAIAANIHMTMSPEGWKLKEGNPYKDIVEVRNDDEHRFS
ncbi:hypothetical protein ACK8P5_26290 (plasmid) [Paenibacillus sp. EC2-1]|uniref:hypothetical protein n=1 Tax=Paenibacillus sp. EC2-1 TaxID=3388665 RepID=UPI003BEF3458